jgi:hypothetical protein
VNAPVPEFLYFAGRIRQYSSVSSGIASSNNGAAQFEHGYSIFIFVTFLDQASSSQAA